MHTKHIVAGFGLSALLISGAAWADAGPFSKKQAEDGHAKFNNHCAQCHGPKLVGAQGPSLVDDKFKTRFAGKPVKELRDFVYQNMPQTAPKSLGDDQLYPILAWIMQNNGVEGGDKDLTKESAESAQFPKK